MLGKSFARKIRLRAPSLRGRFDRLLTIAMLSITGWLTLIDVGNAQTCTIPTGNAQITAACTSVNTISGPQYNNSSLVLQSGSSINITSDAGNSATAQGINITFGNGFNNYSFSNYGPIASQPLSTTGTPQTPVNTTNTSCCGALNDFLNFSQIAAASPAGGDGFSAVNLQNLQINNFTNGSNGSISANWGGGARLEAKINAISVQSSTISQFTNNGTIEAFSTTATVDPSAFDAISLDSSSIGTLTNMNYITAPVRLNNSSNVNVLNNTGAQASINSIVVDDSGSSIQTITNTGFIGAIANSGVIGTLNNFQGVSGSGQKSLQITGNLPSDYNVIVSGQNYGQLINGSASITGMMQFGVILDSSSNPTPGTFDSVLTGIPSSQITNFGNVATLTGGTGGYTYQWMLVQGDATQSGASTIDLRLLSTINQSQPYWLASSIGGFSDPSATTVPVFQSGALRLSQNNTNYNFAFSVSSDTTNTIDAAGLSSTFSGTFSNASFQVGVLNIIDSVGGGSVNFSGASTFTGAFNVNSGTFTLADSGSLAASATISANAAFNNIGTITGAILNSGIFTNGLSGIISGSVTNNTSGTITNFGIIQNAFYNDGILNISGTASGIAGVISGNGTININNGNFIQQAAISNGIINIYNGGSFVATAEVDSVSGININQGGTLNNTSGTISGLVSNNSVLTNGSNGTITGNLTNNAGGNATNVGQITSAVTNSGTFTNDTGSNNISGSIAGAVLNTQGGNFINDGSIFGNVTNNGNFRNDSGFGGVGGTFLNETTGTLNNSGTLFGPVINNGSAFNYGTLSSSLTNTGTFENYGLINGPITNSGTFTNNSTATISSDITNSGDIRLLISGAKLTVDGTYTQTATGRFTTVIASDSRYGTLESTQPLNIANGSVIVALMDPRLRIGPGTVFQGVHKGTGTPVETDINVYTDRPRYKLKAVWSGSNVNLEWLSTYYGALSYQTLNSIAAIQGPTTNALHQRYAVLNAVMEYDCNKFDKLNFCISAQARTTGFGTQTTGAGVFNIAYRPTTETRIGAYLDYQVAAGNPSTYAPSTAGTLSTGSVNYGYDNATFGGYLGYSQSGYSGRMINTGVQAIVSGGYNPGKMVTTRALTLDPYGFDFIDSQPGSGTASLNAYYVRGLLGYGYALTDKATLMPYLGVRYTDVSRGGYMEGFNAAVTQPLVFNAYYERLVTGFGGMMLNGQLTDQFGVTAGLGTELDFSRATSNFGGYSPIAIQGLTTFGFQHGGSWNGFRPTGTVGAYYDVMPNHRVSLNGYAGQQAWSSRTYTTGLLGYQIAF